jgi:hypothetical protein
MVTPRAHILEEVHARQQPVAPPQIHPALIDVQGNLVQKKTLTPLGR